MAEQLPEWVEQQRAHLRSVVVGRIGVHPPWHEPVGDVPVSIDPGPTFGHGAHPTTVLCLAAIDRLLRPGWGVLDVGCGSGVLAIASSRLGAAPVVGVDVDPAAVDWSARNARVNGVDAAFSTTAMSDVDGRFDLVVANMLPSALLAEAPHLVRTAGSLLILSGIPDERSGEVIDAFAPDLTLAEHTHRDGWSGLVFGVD